MICRGLIYCASRRKRTTEWIFSSCTRIGETRLIAFVQIYPATQQTNFQFYLTFRQMSHIFLTKIYDTCKTFIFLLHFPKNFLNSQQGTINVWRSTTRICLKIVETSILKCHPSRTAFVHPPSVSFPPRIFSHLGFFFFLFLFYKFLKDIKILYIVIR